MPLKTKESRRKGFAPAKMDIALAQSLLGFNNNRWMDTSGGGNPKKNLDEALEVQMHNLNLRRAGKSSTANDKRV